MKCESCGKRLKKSDEICPECGSYIVRGRNNNTEIKTEAVTSAESVCNENEIVYKGNIVSLVLQLSLAVFYIGFMIYYMIDRAGSIHYHRTALVPVHILLGAFLCFDAVASFLKEKGCRLVFDRDCIHGTVPNKRYGKQEINIRYEDIEDTVIFFGSKHEHASVSVCLKTDDTFKIYCSHKKTLQAIEDRIQKELTERKIAALNTDVVYTGETVEGSLINGKRYTLVSDDKDGMYEVIDESGETGFYHPEMFEKEEHIGY